MRSFDNKYYLKSAATGPISLAEPYHNDEFSFLQSVAKHGLKIPITGAYTIAVWSYDEHHLPKEGRLGGGLSRKDEVEARRELTLDIARNLIRPNLEALIELGATWIQIDEPGASTEEDELDIFVESFNVSVEGLEAACSRRTSASRLRPLLPRDRGNERLSPVPRRLCELRHREFGTSAADRPGYEVISRWRDLPYDPILGLGVLDIHTDFVESPSSCATGSCTPSRPSEIPRGSTSADCGLRTRSWDVAYEKLRNMVEGASRRGVSEPDARRSDVGTGRTSRGVGYDRQGEAPKGVRGFSDENHSQARNRPDRGRQRRRPSRPAARGSEPGQPLSASRSDSAGAADGRADPLLRAPRLRVAVVLGLVGGTYLWELESLAKTTPVGRFKVAADRLNVRSSTSPPSPSSSATTTGRRMVTPSSGHTHAPASRAERGHDLDALFPRDLVVQIKCPDGRTAVDRINAAYSYCGPEGSLPRQSVR